MATGNGQESGQLNARNPACGTDGHQPLWGTSPWLSKLGEETGAGTVLDSLC